VLATGGGAFMDPRTRELIKGRSISVWLRTDLDVLARRLARKDNRPLLTGKDPMEVLKAQAEARYPAYAEADLTVETGDSAHHVSVDQLLRALAGYVGEPQL
jgi:shikimate kinase